MGRANGLPVSRCETACDGDTNVRLLYDNITEPTTSMSMTPRKVRTAFQLAHLPAQLFSIHCCAGYSLVYCMAGQRRADPVVMLDHADSPAHLALELRHAYPRFAGPLQSMRR